MKDRQTLAWISQNSKPQLFPLLTLIISNALFAGCGVLFALAGRGVIDSAAAGEKKTVIGEKGLGLSEGQVQRLAIARAVLSGAPILLLDEATSALDEDTEEKLLENIKQMTEKTCLIISHKKAAFSLCNKEIRIENGRLKTVARSECLGYPTA